jgi:uncharacterized membrane protein
MKKKLANNLENSKKRNSIVFLIIIFALAIVCFLFSLLIEYQEYKDSKVLNNICTATGSSCNSVQSSQYGHIFGVKVAHIGVIAFALLLLIIILQMLRPAKWAKSILIFGAIIAGLMGIHFIYTQMFILHKYCIYCTIIDSCSIIIMVIAVIYAFKSR